MSCLQKSHKENHLAKAECERGRTIFFILAYLGLSTMLETLRINIFLVS